MSPIALKVQYSILGFLAFLIPSVVLAAIIKLGLDINIPFIVFLAVPIYISIIGIRYGSSKFRKILSHHITGWFVISPLFIIAGALLYEHPLSNFLASKSLSLVACLLIYFSGLFLGTMIGRLIAYYDDSQDTDGGDYYMPFIPWGY